MFGTGSFRPMNGHPVRMGQEASVAAWWPTEGLTSIQRWDALLSRVSQLADPGAREEILQWISRSDIPGTPAERYQVVVADIRNRITPSTPSEAVIVRDRLDSLNRHLGELEAMVNRVETAYGLLPASTEAGSRMERGMVECVSGGIALLGLVILPLILD